MKCRTGVFALGLGLVVLSGGRLAIAHSVLHFPVARTVGSIDGDALASDSIAVYRYDGVTAELVRTYVNPVPGDFSFGRTVAAFGGQVFVGAPEGPGLDHGSVHVFDAGSGSLVRTLESPVAVGGVADRFGFSITAIGGDVLVGAPFDETLATHGGAAYLFDGATGAHLRTFLPPTSSAHAQYGWAVSGVAGLAAVGAPAPDSLAGGPDPAPDRVYVYDPGTGALVRTFAPAVQTAATEFGLALAEFGGGLLVSEPGLDVTHLFDPNTGAEIRTYPAGAESLSVEADRILSGSRDVVRLLDGPNGTLLRTYFAPRSADRFFGIRAALVGGNALVSAETPFAEVEDPPERGAHLFCGGDTACGPCETCGPGGACVGAPNPTCRKPLEPDRTTLGITDSPTDQRDRIIWRARAEIPLGIAQVLGDQKVNAFDTTAFALCFYDESGVTPELIFRGEAPAGQDCGPDDCWSHRFPYRQSPNNVLHRGIRYSDRELSPDGVRLITTQTSIDPSVTAPGGAAFLEGTRIVVRGMGNQLSNRPLGLPSLPLPLPVRVQLQVQEGMCWEATYSTSRVNSDNRFMGRADP